MAAYLRYWRFQSRLHVLSRSLKGSLLKKDAVCQTKKFLSNARILYRQENEDVKPSYSDKDKLSSSVKDTGGLQLDQTLIDALFGQDRKNDLEASASPSNEEYFKQAWQKKLDSLTQDEFSRNVSEKESLVKTKTLDGNNKDSLRSLQGVRDGDDRMRKMDHSDHNERIAQDFPDDEDNERDWRKNIPLTRYGRLGRKAFYYTRKMTLLSREGKVKEAIEVFDDWMMTQDRVLPSKRTFITLIGIVGRAGYTRKAFQLFRQMKHLGLDPPDHVFTSLFNACANCPMPAYGLKRANTLYQQMKDTGNVPSSITTMAAMKAFAMCGDFAMAFQILDESRIPLDTQCLNSLLLACAADKKSGFRTALKVWQKMRESNVTPSHNSYNLLMRCARDCGVGDVSALAEEFDLLGQGQQSENITPFDFFATRQSTSPLLLTEPESCGTENIDRSEGGGQQEGEVICVEGMPAMNDHDVSKLPHYEQAPEEIFECFDNWSVPDGEISRVRRKVNVMHDIISPAYSDGRTVKNKSTAPDASIDREWWEDCDQSNTSVQLYFEDKIDPLHDFPHEKGLANDSNDAVRQLAVLASEYQPDSLTLNPAELTTRPGRLALMGGMTSLVCHMLHQGIQPDIQTFSIMLSCVQNDAEIEAQVLRMMEITGIAPDLDFLNDIMMRRNKRHQSDTVKEVLVLMSKLRLTPNMRTYAALALTCHRQTDALDLLEDMEAANVEPSIEVMGHMIYISRLRFPYKRFLLQKVEDFGLLPTHRIIGMIEKSIAIAKRNTVNAEKMADISDSPYLTPRYQKQFKDFLRFYQAWLQRTELRQDKHPWERFSNPKTKKEKKLQRVEMSK